jgi:hypothetical protein
MTRIAQLVQFRTRYFFNKPTDKVAGGPNGTLVNETGRKSTADRSGEVPKQAWKKTAAQDMLALKAVPRKMGTDPVGRK